MTMQDVGLRATIDNVSTYLKDAERVKSAMNQIGDAATKSAQQAQLAQDRLVVSAQRVATATANTQKAQSQAATAALATQQAQDKAAASAANNASQLSKIGVAAGVVVGALATYKVAVEGVILNSIKLAGELEQTQIAFTTMLGSAEAADSMVRDLFQFAKTTPFQIKDVIPAARLLKAYGFQAAEIIPTLTAVGNAAAGLGLGGEGVERIVVALGQMRAKGAMSGEEMRQLAQAGIPAWEILAKIIGTDIPTAMKMAEERAIPAGKVINQMIVEIGARFPDLMAKQSKTLLGLWSNLQDQATLTFMAIGNAIIKGLDLKGRLATIIKEFERFTAIMSEKGIGGALQELIPPELQTALVALAGVIGGIVVGALVAMAAAAVAAVAPLWPLMAASAALAVAWQQDWGGIREITVGVAKAVIDSVTQIREFIAGARADIDPNIRAIIEAFAWMKAAVDMTEVAARLQRGDFKGALKLAGQSVEELRGTVDREFAATRAAAAQTTQRLQTEMGFWDSIFGNAANKIQGHMAAIKQALRADTGETFEQRFARENAAIVAETTQLQEEAAKSRSAAFENSIAQSKTDTQITEAQTAALKEQAQALRDLGREQARLSLRALERGVQDVEARVKSLTDAVREAQDAMKGFADPRLTGMQEAEDEMFQLDMAIKRARLAELGKDVQKSAKDAVAGFDILAAQQRELAEGIPVPFQKAVWEMEQAKKAQFEGIKAKAGDAASESERLGRLREAKQLMFDLTFEPQLRALRRTFQDLTGANKEITFDDALNGLTASHEQAVLLSSQLDIENASLAEQKAIVEAVRQAQEDQSTALTIADLTSKTIFSIRTETAAVEAGIAQTYERQLDALNKQAQVDLPVPEEATSRFWRPGNEPGLQTGGEVLQGGEVTVGEKGIERVALPVGTTVLPAHAGPAQVSRNFNDTWNISGVTQPVNVANEVSRYLAWRRMLGGRQ